MMRKRFLVLYVTVIFVGLLFFAISKREPFSPAERLLLPLNSEAGEQTGSSSAEDRSGFDETDLPADRQRIV